MKRGSCGVTVTREHEPIPSQYNGEKAYSTGPCGNVEPCMEHPKRADEPNAPPDAKTFYINAGPYAATHCRTCEQDVREGWSVSLSHHNDNHVGWYWQPRLNGPFSTEQEAIDDAQASEE